MNDLEDRFWGPIGTPKRDRMIRNMKRHLWADSVAWKALLPLRWLRITRPLAFVAYDIYDQGCRDDRAGSLPRAILNSAMWSLSWHYLGDFLFDHKPVTTTYWDNHFDRIPWPKRWHVHRAPCIIVGYDHESARPCTRR